MEYQIITPQFDRAEPLGFEVPSNEAEVQAILNVVATISNEVLFEFGFRKWCTMNECIIENQGKPKVNNVSIPALNGPNVELDLGIGNAPTEVLDVDEAIWLFPAEWYSIIPDGLATTGLNGETKIFKRGESSDDRRFGCLAYGIRKPL
jgi:hypothetical protein